MNDHGRRLTRREAEQLLSDPASSRHALGPLLDAARSSQARSDAAREDAAAAAFVVAQVRRATTSAGRTRRPVARGLAAAGLALTVATGGVALAATGNLPDVPLLRDLPTLPDQASDRAAGTTTRPSSPATSSSGTETPGTEEPTDAPESSTPSPSPSLRGLCRAYQARDRTTTGKSLDSAAFRALATAAGGRKAIAGFCVDLVGEPRSAGRGAERPDRPGPRGQGERPAKPEKAVRPEKPETAEKPEPGGKPATGKPSKAPVPSASKGRATR